MGLSVNLYRTFFERVLIYLIILPILCTPAFALTYTTTCQGPTSASSYGNKITVTTNCVECGSTVSQELSGVKCAGKDKITTYCCSFDGKSYMQCIAPVPPGMTCEGEGTVVPDNGNGTGSGNGGYVCKGPIWVADPNGWETIVHIGGHPVNTSKSKCSEGLLTGLCCNEKSTTGNAVHACSASCPPNSVCINGNAGCIPGPTIKCTGQKKPSPDGIYSVTLTSGDKVIASKSNTTNPSYCTTSASGHYTAIHQFCCKTDNEGNEYIGQCDANCGAMVDDSCCIDGKCINKMKCGNGVLETGEQCDDGNKILGDGCDANCTVEKPAPFCGDNILNQTGEQCDPPDGKTCDKNCQKLPVCGNGTIEPGEQCEPPNTATCSATCTNFPTCGNGAQDPGEQCDDGNLIDGDGCDKTCRDEPKKPIPFCGDGKVDPGEMCDDGNTLDGDGCSALCTFPIKIPEWPAGSSNGTIVNDGTFLPPIVTLPSPDKTPSVLSLPIWNQLIKIIAFTIGCSTTTATDGSTWSTTSTNIFSTMNYAPTCKDGTTLTGFVCVNNKLVTQAKACAAGTMCKNGKCAK